MSEKMEGPAAVAHRGCSGKAKRTAAGDEVGGWPALITAGLSVALILIDGFIISAAAPQITSAFAIGPDHMGWLIAAYTLPLAVGPMIFGMAGDRFGVKRLFVFGMSLLIAASVLCAMSASFPELTACRFLQGLGAAMLSPQTLAVAAQSLGAERRGFAIGVWGSVSSLGLLLGPVLGGVMLAYLPWHSIFLMNLPLGLLAILAFASMVPVAKGAIPTSRRLPLANIGLLISGAGVIVLSLGSLFRGDMLGGGGIVLGGCLLSLWLKRERDPRNETFALMGRVLLGNDAFSKAAAAAFAMNASTAGTVAVLSLTVARTHAAPSIVIGLLFLPAMIAVAACMPLAGKLAQSRSMLSRRLLLASTAIAVVSPLLIGASLAEKGIASLVLCAIAIAAQGIAGAVLLSYATFSALVAAGPLRSGLASGAISMSRNLGTAIGAATLTAAAAISATPERAFIASAFLALLSLPFCLRYLQPVAVPEKA